MSGCPKQPTDARIFVVAAYVEGADGRLEPGEVSACPVGDGGDNCVISNHEWRSRKTGPRHPLRVARCRPHTVFFTIYPPGHVPYGRRPIAPLAPDGGSTVGSDAGLERFEGTYLDAALDAANGDAWARHCPGGTDRWWSTQHRRLERATLLLGVAPQLDQALRARVAEVLDVDGGLLDRLAIALREAAGYRSRGRACREVLEALGPTWPAYWRLGEAGWLVGAGRRPASAEPPTGRLLTTPFRAAVARSPPTSAPPASRQ